MGPSHLRQEDRLFLSEGLGISQLGKISQQAPKGGAQRYFGLRISHGRHSYRLSGVDGQMQRKGVPFRCKFPRVQLSTEREAVRGVSPNWRLSLGRLLEPEQKTTLARPRLGKESVRNAGEGATAPCHRKRRWEAGEGKARKNLAYLNRNVEVAGPVLGRSGRGALARPTASAPVPGFRHHLSDLPSMEY